MRRRKVTLTLGALVGTPLVIWFFPTIARTIHAMQVRITGSRTVQQRLDEHGPAARARLAPDFARAAVPYPPARLTLVGIKEDRRLLVYASAPNAPPDDAGWTFIRAYPILGASGALGPKLRDGDRQVPEGLYAIESLNPNSRFHLSLRISYPSPLDRDRARTDARTNLGGDIMIHGGSASIGCLAMGDPAAEELFVLAADTGLPNIEVILAPIDFRTPPASTLPVVDGQPRWVADLYAQIAAALTHLPLPESAK